MFSTWHMDIIHKQQLPSYNFRKCTRVYMNVKINFIFFITFLFAYVHYIVTTHVQIVCVHFFWFFFKPTLFKCYRMFARIPPNLDVNRVFESNVLSSFSRVICKYSMLSDMSTAAYRRVPCLFGLFFLRYFLLFFTRRRRVRRFYSTILSPYFF